MKLHEYQAKQLFIAAGIPVPYGVVAHTPQAAAAAYAAVKAKCKGGDGFLANVKAQLHAGGRGKVGGVVGVKSPEEAASHAERLLGKRLVTKQTGPEGLPVSAVLIDERTVIVKELYLALTIDRFNARPVILASREGGVDIEEVAATHPGAIIREIVDLDEGITDAACARVAATLGLTGPHAAACATILRGMWTVFIANDANLIEVNPLAISRDNELVAV